MQDELIQLQRNNIWKLL